MKFCFVKVSPVEEIASKFASAEFQKFLSAGVQKMCRKCRFFGLEGTLVLGKKTR